MTRIWLNLGQPLRSARLPQAALTHFVRTLADLLSAGIDLPWALQTVAELTSNRMLSHSCIHQAQAIAEGEEWSTILAESRQPKWPAIFIGWMTVAIRTGALVDCLTYQHREMLETVQLRRDLGKRLTYPIALLVLSILLTLFTGIQFQQDASQALTLVAGIFIASASLAAVSAHAICKTGGWLEQRCWLRCLQALAISTRAGLSWPQALGAMTTDLSLLWRGHPSIGRSLADCLYAIGEGRGLYTAAEDAGFPQLVLRNLRMAEISGDLPAALTQASQLFDIKQKECRDRLLGWIPTSALALAAITLACQYGLFIRPLYMQMGDL